MQRIFAIALKPLRCVNNRFSTIFALEFNRGEFGVLD